MKRGEVRFLSCLYVLSLVLLALYAVHGLTASVAVSGAAVPDRLIILDAGHGGTDGGSSAADGTRECDINLAVVRKTDAVLGLLGERTLLTRTMDTDLADENAKTIAQKKVSDIRGRVALVNEHPEAVLVSIHQNIYSEEKYYGAQVFYGKVGESKALAETLQENLRACVDPSNTRSAKAVAADVYLMNHIEVPGILVECGFLSNRAEAEKLQTADYQKKLAVVIGVTAANQLTETEPGV